jgi:hypothetical protein
MTEGPDAAALAGVAADCARLVAADRGRDLDGSPASLETLDEVCQELVADGPLEGDRLRWWTALVGAYTGEVVIRRYGGAWVSYDGATAISALGVTGFPFGLAHRILTGEPYKSLASFERTLPAVSENARSAGPAPDGGADPPA